MVAIGLNAKVIEKHFTLNKNLKGPDHKFALDPKQLKIMVSSIRTAERMLGINKKKVMKEEMELKKFAKRSIQAIKDIEKGEVLIENENFAVLRPGHQKRGEEPRFLKKINGKTTKRRIHIGEGIKSSDCL